MDTAIYLGTADGLYVVGDSSGSDGEWHGQMRLKSQVVRCITAGARGSKTLYCGAFDEGVYRSDDGGASWGFCDGAPRRVLSLAVAGSEHTSVLYAGTEPSAVFRSDDGGASWHELPSLLTLASAKTWSFPPRPWTSHVRWIAPNPHDPAVLIIGIELGGLMYTSDGGQTWLDHRPNAQRDVHMLAWHPTAPDRAYEAGGGGSAWSKDGGLNWQRIDAGRDRHYTWALAVDPADPDCWFISACPGPREAHYGVGSAQAYIYRWRGAGPWQPLGGGLPQPLTSLPYALAIAPGQFYAGLGDGRLYASYDLGDSWQQLHTSGDALPRILALACVGDL